MKEALTKHAKASLGHTIYKSCLGLNPSTERLKGKGRREFQKYKGRRGVKIRHA